MEQGRCCYVELPNSNKLNAGHSKFVDRQGISACDKVNENALKEAAKHQKEVARVLTPGEAAVGNVWGSNDVTDTVRLITNQMDRRRRINRARELKSSGLGLLSALQEIDSEVVTSTLGVTHTGGGVNTNGSAANAGASAISGIDDNDTDSLVASEAPEVNANSSNTMKVYDNTPFSVSLLPAHIRQSQGSMAGIKNLSFLRLNKKKAEIADKIALDKGFIVDPNEVKKSSIIKGTTSDADDMAMYDSMIIPESKADIDAASLEKVVDVAENENSVSVVSKGQEGISGSNGSADDMSIVMGDDDSVGGTKENSNVNKKPEEKPREGSALEAKSADLNENTAACTVAAEETKKNSFAKSVLKLWGKKKLGEPGVKQEDELSAEERAQQELDLYLKEQEELKNRPPVSVPENPDFLKVPTDIPVVKSKAPFAGTLLSTVAEAPLIIKEPSMYQTKRKMPSKKKEKVHIRRLQLVVNDKGVEEYMEVLETDEETDDYEKPAQNDKTPEKEMMTDYSKPYQDSLKVLSPEEERLLKDFSRFGVTKEILEKNEEAGYNTDEFLSLVSVREIVHLSTFHNLKYMNVGDKGLVALTQALTNDAIVQYMILDHAHVTGVGVRSLCRHIHTMSMLCYLDLSQNAVDDNGACALAVALENCFAGSSNFHFSKIREAEEKRLLLLGEQQSVGSGASADNFSLNTDLYSPISNVASNDTVDGTPIVFMKTLPLRTLVLRANRITDVGATALLNVLDKLTNKLNYSRFDKNRNVQDDIDISICQCKNELPKWVPDSSLDHILRPNETSVSNWKGQMKGKTHNNFFGLTRPEKKLYPRNPLKKVAPVTSPEQAVVLPLSDDAPQNAFLTSTSKIKAALMPQMSKQVQKSVNHRVTAVVPFYLK